jgi:hypothetical protein
VFTPDGLQFNLEVLFYYKLDTTKLAFTYSRYSKNYDIRVQSIATLTIKNLATRYTINDYIHSRRDIEKNMSLALEAVLVADVGVIVPPQFFRLMSVTVPDTLLKTNLVSAIELQNNEIRAIQQTITLIKSETSQMTADIYAQAALVLAYAQTQANQEISTAQQYSDNIQNSARSVGIQMVLEALNVTDPAVKLQFVQKLAYLDANKSKVLRTGQNVLISV